VRASFQVQVVDFGGSHHQPHTQKNKTRIGITPTRDLNHLILPSSLILCMSIVMYSKYPNKSLIIKRLHSPHQPSHLHRQDTHPTNPRAPTTVPTSNQHTPSVKTPIGGSTAGPCPDHIPPMPGSEGTTVLTRSKEASHPPTQRRKAG